MRTLLTLFLGLVLLLATTGCGGDKDHGKFKDKDRPHTPKG